MPFEPSFPVFSLWFCQSDSLRNRANEIVSQLLRVEPRRSWNENSLTEIHNLPFGSVVVLEIARDMTVCGVPVGSEDGLLNQILNDPSMPIVLCIGDLIPAQQVMDWLRLGVFSYVEREADDIRFINSIRATANHSIEVQEHFLRYDRLRELWTSVSQREATVLDMILDGVPNKTIANRLGVSQRTIEARRQKLYQKLESRSLPEVVRTVYEYKQLEKEFHGIDVHRAQPLAESDLLSDSEEKDDEEEGHSSSDSVNIPR